MTSPNPEGIIPSVILPNSRSSLNPLYSSSFQALDTNTVYVLGEDGNLWLEHGGNDEWGQVPPPRERVDGNVRAFQALDANNVYVLGSNGNLWLEHSVNGKFGQVPPPRDHVDGNVAAFQAMNSEQVYVLGTDGNLWLEHSVNGKFGQVPPPRDHVDGNVAAFVALPQDVNTIYVLGTDGNLWLEHSVNGKFGQVPPPRDHIDGNVIALQPIDYNTVYVLGEDGNLWLEHSVNGKFGQVPPPREHVDGNVMAFQAFSADTIFVLGKDGNLWSEYPVNGKFGAIPPPRTPYAAGCLDFQVLTLPPPNQPFNFIMFQLGTDGSLGWGYDDPRPVDGNVMLPVAYGTIRPAYVIMTLVYAPPGTTTTMSVQTNVQYANGSTTGTTTSASSSFKGAVDVKAQVGGMLDSASVDFSASKSETDSQSVEFTQGRSFTITVHGPSQDGINHDDDLFYLWLNPTLSVTVDPHKSVSWMISIDGQEMNIQPVAVGELKNPATMPAEPEAGTGCGWADAVRLPEHTEHESVRLWTRRDRPQAFRRSTTGVVLCI